MRQQSSPQIFEGLACLVFSGPESRARSLGRKFQGNRVLPLDKEYLTPEDVQQWGAL